MITPYFKQQPKHKQQQHCLIKLMKGKALRKHSLHEKTAASVLLKLFIYLHYVYEILYFSFYVMSVGNI